VDIAYIDLLPMQILYRLSFSEGGIRYISFSIYTGALCFLSRLSVATPFAFIGRQAGEIYFLHPFILAIGKVFFADRYNLLLGILALII
jgi:hypothetical protein